MEAETRRSSATSPARDIRAAQSDSTSADSVAHEEQSTAFIKDIKERSLHGNNPPSAPVPRVSLTGFPSQKQRAGQSRFKANRSSPAAAASKRSEGDLAPQGSTETAPAIDIDLEKRLRSDIDAENKNKLAQMTDYDIARERRELLHALSPSLVEKLLQRSSIDDVNGPITSQRTCISDDNESSQTSLTQEASSRTSRSEGDYGSANAKRVSHGDFGPSEKAEAAVSPDQGSEQRPMHAQNAPEPPELDPHSANFLDELHEKYFPSLPTDPSKLAWMADIGSEEESSPYSPNQENLLPSALRFSFKGQLLPPRTAREIPVTEGLHHHGDAPESAGYTLPELARLARSAFPAQRCMSYQTLGRVLYRLGRGEFGGTHSDMAAGLRKCIKDGKVLETLQEESQKQGGHLSAKAYATEALWLWQRGGGHVVVAE